MDIVTLAAARKGGGGGGDVTKAYVDEHLALKADKSETKEYPIASTTTGINPTITDSANGFVQNVKVYGESRVSKNLLDVQTVTVNNITWTVDSEKYFTASPNNSDPRIWSYANAQWKLTLPAGTYTFVYNATPASTYNEARLQLDTDGGVNIYGSTLTGKTELVTHFTVSSTTNIGIMAKIYDGKGRIMICKKSDYDTDPTFEPYFSGIHGIGEDGELNVQTIGKNLISSWASGYINTADGKTVEPNLYWTYTPNYIALDNDRDYVISADITNRAALFYYDATKNFISVSTGIMTSSKQYAITTKPAGTKYIRLGFNVSGASVPITAESMPTYKVQVELGTTTTAYEPYISSTASLTTGIPLYAVGDVKGELNEKKGVVVKRCKKVVFDGSEDENWELESDSSTSSSGSKRFKIRINPASTGVSAENLPHLICDNLAPTNAQTLWFEGDGGIGTNASGNYILVRVATVSTVADLKTYLASNPVTVVYELAEPYEIPLTSAELSALRNLRTYSPTTNVTITDAPTVDIGYLLDTDNGQAVADVQTDLQGQINTIPAWLTDIPENHKNIYRGKYLGNSVSAAQLAAIADGSFDDLYVGDYWEIPVTIDGTTVSNKWRIADFDYFLHNGTDKHHAVIVPDNTLYTDQMGGNISYGYYQSAMFTTNLNKGRTAIADAFPDMVISYEYYDIINSTVTKYDCTVELMTLSSLTGVYSDYIHANYLPVLPQMSLFRIMPDFIGANPNGSGHDAGFLTQTVKTSSFYWAISTRMAMMEMRTSDSYGVRPFFLLGDAGT